MQMKKSYLTIKVSTLMHLRSLITIRKASYLNFLDPPLHRRNLANVESRPRPDQASKREHRSRDGVLLLIATLDDRWQRRRRIIPDRQRRRVPLKTGDDRRRAGGCGRRVVE